MRVSQPEVEVVLKQIKKARAEKRLFLVSRAKNKESLTRCGLLAEDAYDAINDLEYCNYKKGPEDDRDRPADKNCMWFFKKDVCGHLFYIKIKVQLDKDNIVKVVSFHLDFI
ncbi:MAG: hypothetical protein R3Y06_08135 [Faecalibacterium sp.]